MELFFKDIDFHRYKRLSTLIVIVGDIILVMYLNSSLTMPDNFNRSIDLALQIMASEGQQLTLPMQERIRLFGLLVTWVRTILVTYFCLHLIVYWFYFTEKKWAQTYVKILNWMAAPTAVLFSWGLKEKQAAMSVVFLLLSLFFVWNIIGQRKFSQNNIDANKAAQ